MVSVRKGQLRPTWSFPTVDTGPWLASGLVSAECWCRFGMPTVAVHLIVLQAEEQSDWLVVV